MYISYSFLPVIGSLSEDAPPPSRGMAVGQAAFSARHAHPMALARSLPVSVPVWGCRGSRGGQGDGNSGERVRTAGLHAEIKMSFGLYHTARLVVKPAILILTQIF